LHALLETPTCSIDARNRVAGTGAVVGIQCFGLSKDSLLMTSLSVFLLANLCRSTLA
jgi:hypothetical protein